MEVNTKKNNEIGCGNQNHPSEHVQVNTYIEKQIHHRGRHLLLRGERNFCGNILGAGVCFLLFEGGRNFCDWPSHREQLALRLEGQRTSCL